MAVTVTTSLVGANVPQSVLIAVNGTTAGQHVVVTGTTIVGFTWPIPGGDIVSTGEQIVVVDTRSPIREELVYEVSVDGTVYSTTPLTVPSPGDFVLQSLDGMQNVVPAALLDSDFALGLEVHASLFQVPGRRRPVVRYDFPADGGTVFSVLTDVEETQALIALLSTGAPLVYRMTRVRDLPPSEVVHVQAASSVSNQDDYSRIWTLDCVFIDDPDPSQVPNARTWDMFDATYTGSTWNAFDAEWAGSTWDAFDLEDWSQR